MATLFGLCCLLGTAGVLVQKAAVAQAKEMQASDDADVDLPLTSFSADAVRPLNQADARVINARMPVILAGAAPAAAFRPLFNAPEDRKRSLECLASAIYYEAAQESDAGQRAVAQVVLNRVAHISYPNTVCGVVYQGSERPTGCQFTFTCDGSLARRPSALQWARAMRAAEAALTGSVAEEVGRATHYHADYVVPYWASSLLKTATIGRHIFYSSPGRTGSVAAFSARYAGTEPMFRAERVAAQAPSVTSPESRHVTSSVEALASNIAEDRAEEMDRFSLLSYKSVAASAGVSQDQVLLEQTLIAAKTSRESEIAVGGKRMAEVRMIQ